MKTPELERSAPILREERVDSTNTRLRELARTGAGHGTVLIAESQSGGRGRAGRSFESPKGGIYISILFRPEKLPERLYTLTACAALAVRRTIAEVCGVTADIKWPNDLLLDGKKICGILTESVIGSDVSIVLGIGINLNTGAEMFPQELRETVGSVLSASGIYTDKELFTERLITALDEMYVKWTEDESCFLDEYRAACINIGREVRIVRDGGTEAARALDVDGDFSLAVEYPDGRKENIRFGEVSLRDARHDG